mmetsp:Transcript_17603/g.48302  ORF Transcript_17603/g.48302 Transcript_17603/m.48302 type:complete len:256 (-) Transcript_17603:92-859(-)
MQCNVASASRRASCRRAAGRGAACRHGAVLVRLRHRPDTHKQARLPVDGKEVPECRRRARQLRLRVRRWATDAVGGRQRRHQRDRMQCLLYRCRVPRPRGGHDEPQQEEVHQGHLDPAFRSVRREQLRRVQVVVWRLRKVWPARYSVASCSPSARPLEAMGSSGDCEVVRVEGRQHPLEPRLLLRRPCGQRCALFWHGHERPSDRLRRAGWPRHRLLRRHPRRDQAEARRICLRPGGRARQVSTTTRCLPCALHA